MYKVKERISRMSYSIIFRIFIKIFKPKFFRIFLKRLINSAGACSGWNFGNRPPDVYRILEILETYLFRLTPTVGVIYKSKKDSAKKYLFKQFFFVKPKFIYLGIESTLSFAIKFITMDFTVFFRKDKFGKNSFSENSISSILYGLINGPQRMPGAIFKKYVQLLVKKRSRGLV